MSTGRDLHIIYQLYLYRPISLRVANEQNKIHIICQVRVDCQHEQDSKSRDKSTNTACYVNFSNKKKKTLAPKLSITISTGSSYHSRKVVKWVFQVLIFFFFPLLEGKRYNQEREA